MTLLDAILRWPALRWLYRNVIVHLPAWPLPRIRPAAGAERPRIAYYLWHFPVLSQTFICRELLALQQAGLSVHVFADGAEAGAFDPETEALKNATTYLDPTNEQRRRHYHWRSFRRHPLSYLRVLAYILTHRYRPSKDLADDVTVFSRAVYLAGVLDDHAVSHVHAPWADHSAFLAMLAATLLRVPYSVQGRAHDIHRDASLPGLVERLRAADFVITNSEYNQRYLTRLLDGAVARPTVVAIRNGIDLAGFRPPAERGEQAEKAETHILCVARLIEQKGLLDLLTACRQLLDRGDRLRCEIIGAGEPELYMNYLLRLRKAHRRLGLDGCVEFLGARPFAEVLDHYARADLFVLPCVIAADGSRDITPNALIEAMAMALPVISTTVSAVPEMVEDGVSGLLVPPHRPSALAAAMARLIDDPELRRRLGRAARQRVEARFDIRRNVEQYVRLFSIT